MNKADFKILNCAEIKLLLFGQEIRYQAFLSKVHKYDLVIVEDAVYNLSYPLSHLLKPSSTKFCYWGHGRDVTIDENAGRIKKIIEDFKLSRVRLSDGYFAYTEGVKQYLVSQGVEGAKIFTVQNTIDIQKERAFFKKNNKEKDPCPRSVIFVGRLTDSKKVDYLLEVFESLQSINADYQFSIVGTGDKKYEEMVKKAEKRLNLCYYGKIIDSEKLAKIFIDHSLYVFPGYVGLGPLHAMCYNLIPVIRESTHHKPEVEYLNKRNALLLPENISSENYALKIESLVQDESRFRKKRNQVWPSISSYTIENMAKNFISGINKVLSN